MDDHLADGSESSGDSGEDLDSGGYLLSFPVLQWICGIE